MKQSVDCIEFLGSKSVLDKLESERSMNWIHKIKSILDMEIEIPVSGILIASVCCLALCSIKVMPSKTMEPTYPIMVINNKGGVNHYEIY